MLSETRQAKNIEPPASEARGWKAPGAAPAYRRLAGAKN